MRSMSRSLEEGIMMKYAVLVRDLAGATISDFKL